MNTQIFLAINNLAGHSARLDKIGIFFAEYFIYVFAVAVVLLWLKKELRINVYLAIASAIVSRLVIVEIIKRLVNHPRPYEILPHMHQLIADSERGMSFPSGHTVILFSLAFAFYGTKYFWPFVVLATLGSVARVFTGLHFPVDILASIVIAGLTVWLVQRLFKNRILS